MKKLPLVGSLSNGICCKIDRGNYMLFKFLFQNLSNFLFVWSLLYVVTHLVTFNHKSKIKVKLTQKLEDTNKVKIGLDLTPALCLVGFGFVFKFVSSIF